MNRLRLATTLCLPLLALAAPAFAASTLRCGSGLVSLGDHASEVQSKCGQPRTRDFLGYRQVLDDDGYQQEVSVEEWSYAMSGGMLYFLRFEGNRLAKIESKRGN
ncbi:DUF2845 domain-containing protein [Pseudomonas sp. LS44]|uniref:DUF2845 domain-containing protein n=1 Tax=Pseudomonas sp. LS44 TaxID=1357074 RepID=UPI00215A61F0|nr:DUF2845 domain-containing protein [Pseudomonas sp. LS44]UVE17057.1 DUF2845 domain-containing protein [Pseudomonas sp. LS44]